MVDYEFRDPHTRDRVIPPDTGIHGVKMANGHLHINNHTYNYFDPSQPHDESIHEARNNGINYLFAGAFVLVFALILGFVLYRVYK